MPVLKTGVARATGGSNPPLPATLTIFKSKIMNLNNLNKYILEDILSPEHPSDFIRDSNVLILRLPFIEDSKVIPKSLAFVFEDGVVYIYNRDKKRLEELGDFNQFHNMLDKIIDKILKNIKDIHLKIDDLEDAILEDSNTNIMANWLLYKKNASLIRRLVFQAYLAYEMFLMHFKREKNFDFHAFDDINEHMERIKNLALAAEDKLNNLHDFYRAKTDEKMNRNVYYLTIISGIFLPLTLITGFFGMNTGGLPLTDNPNGTAYVILFSIILEILFLIIFFAILKFKQSK